MKEVDKMSKNYGGSDFEQLTIGNTVNGIALTKAKLGSCNKAIVTVEAASLRYRVDGGFPTSTVGHIAYVGDIIELESSSEMTNFRAIREGSVDSKITVTYLNEGR